MSYTDFFNTYGRSDTAERRLWIYFHKPASLYELDRVAYYDRDAAGKIAELQAYIDALKEYRQDLAARYAELSTMVYTYKLYLTREKSWSTKLVTYTVRLARVLPNGKEIDERREVFAGAERKKAFELFAEIKKERPGIETEQDTERKQWEK